MSNLARLIAAQPICTDLTMGAGGKILDGSGRVICTMNLKANGPTLAEAWVYANLFIAGAAAHEAILRALDVEATP